MGKSTIIVAVVLFASGVGSASAEESSYAGVTPGSETSENLPPKADEIPEGALMLTWPGFMMLEDGSSFFIQTSKPVKFGTRKSEGRLELVLHNTQVHLKNNFLPLETQFFDTPVVRATVQRKGKKSLVMVFEMREDATPSITQKIGKDGFNYVFVKFSR
ncbi:MAG: hypothetical protein KJO40_18925 [Deltaproteobacteria bacterium]|nr:hypothetical protein [Deltaproteobacteria bacterium]NND30771.1 hypothetical protein [Myxococcales bacterium]MBT8463339.1 hypothetical protein [Deltaproteobacteria bacterium]MBT8482964.1 hypothetical protein [Deltaproteobacteria bacterium]NNK07513.1 hypothetical protein [Myxococcales bacterium]